MSALSPYTGWHRENVVSLADRLLDGALPYTSPSGSLIGYPGSPGGNGANVDALEGFARTFMMAAFRIAGDPGGTTELAVRFARGIASGADPRSAERWVRISESPQAKVEAAAIAIGLHVAREQVWGRLDDAARRRVIDYLSEFIGAPYPPNNWAWFRIIVEQFLANVGAPYSDADLAHDFALLDSFERNAGWASDGRTRAFDHYSGWVLRLYPIIWADMVGDDPRWADRVARYRRALDDYLDDALHLIGADGAPLVQGRSLVYRFAAAGPAWAAAFSGSTRHDLGLLRRAACGQLSYFTAHGAPDDRALLSLGWHDEWRDLAQVYSGTGSPYWAAKGLLGLALPADHPVWSATEQPLPVERGQFARIIDAPGWIATGVDDGIVRVLNHGTDHKRVGEYQPDGPLYAKFGYSTATFPVLRGEGATHPLDGTVSLIRAGRPSHRSGFERGRIAALDSTTVVAASLTRTHWPVLFAANGDHGHGDEALEVELGPALHVVSVVRGAWEVRFVKAEPPARGLTLRIGGWALTGEGSVTEDGVAVGRMRSRVVPLHGIDLIEVADMGDVTPLAGNTTVPYAIGTITGGWQAVALHLGTQDHDAPSPSLEKDGLAWSITWHDGTTTPLAPDAWVLNNTKEER